jgi:hypothetical protein
MELATNVPGRVRTAPARVIDRLQGTPTTYVSINWDPNFFGRDRGAGFATSPVREGGQAIVAAWTGARMSRDNVVADLAKADRYQQALATVFAEAVARNEAALSELRSNLPMDAKFSPKNGTFDFVLDRPGSGNDLRYVGLIEAAPAPIRDILDAATGFRRHF